MAKIINTGKRIIESEKEEEKVENPTLQPKQILTQFINSIEVEEEISYKNIKIFPLHLKSTDLRTVKLKTLDEALKENILEIQETNVVANLKFINKSKTDKILIVEGDIVQGGRQNRVVNVTMILDENSATIVPTSCVEQHRWSGIDQTFKSNNKLSPELHDKLTNSVYYSYTSVNGRGMAAYASNQSALWSGVDHQLGSLGVSSENASFSDSYVVLGEDIKDYLEKIMPHINSCCGIAAVINNKIIVSITDSNDLFMPTIKATLESYIIDALNTKIKPQHDAEAVVKALNECADNQIDLLESPNKIGQIIKLVAPCVGSAFLYRDSIVNMIFTRG